MRIALASCDPFPSVPDDEGPLRDALSARGVQVDEPAWDAPGVDWSVFDACLIRTTWDYMDQRDVFVAWTEAADRATRLFHPPAVVAWNTHKSYLRELADAGAPLAETIWLDPGDTPDLPRRLAERGWSRAFAKPLIGATARNTLRFRAETEELGAAEHQIASWLAVEPMMLQPYLPAVETEGELSIVFVDGEITHGVRKVPVPGDYRVQDDFGAHDELWDPPAADRRLATDIERTARAILGEDLLYSRVDFLRDAGGGLVLNEFEAVEPSLFFRHCPEAADRLADALLARFSGAGTAG